MATIKDVYDFIDSIAPFDTQFSYDNAGLIIGEKSRKVTKIGVALDATDKVIEEAVKQGCDLLVSHHPIIFHAVKELSFTSPVAVAIKNNLPILSAHTNLDIATEGVNFALANKLELKDIENMGTGEEILWVGKTDRKTPEEFAEFISEKLDTMVSFAPSGKGIETVAVCGGSAGEFLYKAAEMGLDAYITGEIKHHEYLDAKRLGLSIYCAGHFETENPVVPLLAKKIKESTGIETVIIQQEKPVKYIKK